MKNNLDPLLFSNSKTILSDNDKQVIKLWVKHNFIPNSMVNAFWHVYVKTEWEKSQKRYILSEKMNKLDRESKAD